MIYDLFYEKIGELSAYEKEEFINFFNFIKNTCGDDLSIFNDYDMVKDLFYMNQNTLSRAVYFKRKRFIKMLYNWLYETEAVEASMLGYVDSIKYEEILSDGELSMFYFKNLDEVLNSINEAGKYSSRVVVDLIDIKSAAILIWHGLSTTEIINLKKHDLNMLERSINANSEKKLMLSDKYFEIIYGYSKARQLPRLTKGSKFLYNILPSDYLFRTNRSEQMSSLVDIIKYINKLMDKKNKGISIPILQRNGAFCRIFENESNVDSIIQELIKLLDCDRQSAAAYAKLYEKWKDLYHK